MAKNAQFLEMGPANVYLYSLPQADLVVSGAPYNADVYLKALRGGAAGNNITIQLISPTPGPSALSVSVADKAITVSLANDAYDVITSTADDVIDALTRSAQARGLVTAARGVGQNGTGLMTVSGPTNLADGSDTGVARDVGYLGEGVIYQVTTEANPLTGAQAGNTPLNKVVVGGMVKLVLPFKEINPDNFAAGVPSARVIKNEDGSMRRIDFVIAVGSDLRSQAIKVEIRKIKGGFESADPDDIIIIPECSPAEGEVNFPFAPTTQREIVTNWYAWPNDETGRWAYTGDELP